MSWFFPRDRSKDYDLRDLSLVEVIILSRDIPIAEGGLKMMIEKIAMEIEDTNRRVSNIESSLAAITSLEKPS